MNVRSPIIANHDRSWVAGSEIAAPVAKCLVQLCASSFDTVKLPPLKATEADFEEIIGRPLYILFRHLCLGHDASGTTIINNLINLTVALHQIDERTVHHLLYYIQLQELQARLNFFFFNYNFLSGIIFRLDTIWYI